MGYSPSNKNLLKGIETSMIENILPLSSNGNIIDCSKSNSPVDNKSIKIIFFVNAKRVTWSQKLPSSGEKTSMQKLKGTDLYEKQHEKLINNSIIYYYKMMT